MPDPLTLRPDKGEWAPAAVQGQIVLRRHQEVIGKGRPDTLTSSFNLAAIYHLQGRYQEAEVLQSDTWSESLPWAGHTTFADEHGAGIQTGVELTPRQTVAKEEANTKSPY